MIGDRRYDHHQERIPHGGRAHVDDLHPSAGFFLEHAVVLDDLVPTGHFLIAAELESEEFFGCGDLSANAGSKREQNKRQKTSHGQPGYQTGYRLRLARGNPRAVARGSVSALSNESPRTEPRTTVSGWRPLTGSAGIGLRRLQLGRLQDDSRDVVRAAMLAGCRD